MRLVTVAEMRAIEKEGNARGVSYAEMMERAGTGVARIVHELFNRSAHDTVTALVGTGNNGGDALVALEALASLGWRARAILVRPRPEGDSLINRVELAGGEFLTLNGNSSWNELETWKNSRSR
ncbi:MAG: NAD(P)H-hydrate epimerase, partial [Bellilinea sp.]